MKLSAPLAVRCCFNPAAGELLHAGRHTDSTRCLQMVVQLHSVDVGVVLHNAAYDYGITSSSDTDLRTVL